MDVSDRCPAVTAARPAAALEPADRAAVAKRLFQTPHDTPTPRFECADPLSTDAVPVTYRGADFDDIAAQADRVGATRIDSLDACGRRTTWSRERGHWIAQPAQRPGLPTPRPGARPATEPEVAARLVPLQRAAQQADESRRIAASLDDQYVITRGPSTLGDLRRYEVEYRERGGGRRVAFTASLFRICTDSPHPSVARSMVDVAELRRWGALRVSGDESFRRMVWLVASARGVQALGYEPSCDDLVQLRRLRAAQRTLQIERAAAGVPPLPVGGAAGGACAPPALPRWLQALQEWLIEQQLPAAVCDAVVAAAGATLARGDAPHPHPFRAPAVPHSDPPSVAGRGP
jgi:hypothetical protein